MTVLYSFSSVLMKLYSNLKKNKNLKMKTAIIFNHIISNLSP